MAGQRSRGTGPGRLYRLRVAGGLRRAERRGAAEEAAGP
jgi:hypothetical protein